MTVILLTQEANSRGDQVAVALAAYLGFELVRQEQIEQCVAERMQVGNLTVRRVLDGEASLVETWMIGRNRLARCVAEEVAKLAARGDIVVQSRRPTDLLGKIGHAVCVHVCAALPRLAGGSGAVAPQRRSRPSWARIRCRRLADNREDSENYDVVLDTERISVDECAEQVCRLLQGSHFQPITVSRAMPARLAQETCEAALPILGSDAARAAPLLEVDVAGDTIRLPTAVSNEEAIALVEQHLRRRKDRGGLAARGSSPVILQETF